MSNKRREARRQESYARNAKRKEARRAAALERKHANRLKHINGELTPWEHAKAARRSKRKAALT